MKEALRSAQGDNLRNEHRIAEGIKTIPFLNSNVICFKNFLAPRKRADQHDQRGFRQMEIRNHRIHNLELIAGENEDGGGASKSSDQ